MDKVTLAVSTLATLSPSTSINATGYNILDNYIYGLRSRDFMQLASDGTYVMLGQPTGINDSAGVTWAISVTYAGTMDSSGYWYGHDTNYVYRVYIGPSPSVGSLTFERFARSGTYTGRLADLAFNPLDGSLYGMSGNALRKISLDGVSSTVTVNGTLTGNAGGAWSTSSGTLYFYNNGSGLLFSVDMTQSTPEANFVGDVDRNGTFDATACTPPVLGKSVGADSAEPGDIIDFTFSLSNPLSTAIAVEFSDVLDPSLSFVAGSLSPAAPGSGTVTTFNDDTLIISNLTIPAGLSPNNEVNFTAQVLVNPDIIIPTVITNQAKISYGVNTTVSDNPGGSIDDATPIIIYLSDWGDAPASYGDAKHIVSDTTTFLGGAPDVETQSQNAANGGADGTGDDDTGTADEDGVKFPTMVQGAFANISIDINQASAKQGYLQAWIDWNGDGDFADANEQIATDLQSATAGNSTLTLSTLVPASATLTQTFARFRWSTTSGLDSTTPATNGEVEDYAVIVEELTPAFPPGTGLSPSLCEAVSPSNPWQDIGFRWTYNDNNGTSDAVSIDRTDLIASATVATFSGIQGQAGSYSLNIQADQIPSIYDPNTYIQYQFTTTNFDGVEAEVTGFGATVFGKSTATDDQDTGAYRFAIAIDDDPTFASPDVLINEIIFDGIDTSSAAATQGPDNYGNYLQSFGHWDANGQVIQIVPNTTYTIRIFPYGVARYGGTYGQPFTNQILIDDFTPKVLSCVTSVTDYSDTPADGSASPNGTGITTYGEATHLVIDGIQLGASITGETSTVEDADDASDDGVIAPALIAGTTQDVIIAAADLTGTGTGTLHGWIDFDGDGAFSAAEYASVAFNNGASGDLSFSGYGTVMSAGSTFARFRLSSDTLTDADTATLAIDGEVEDYVISVKPADWGDAPSSMITIDAALTNPYGDAIHGIDKIHYLGNLIDVDTASQSTGLLADGDDIDGSNDDDGVTFPLIGSTPVLRVDIANTVKIEASAAGYLNAWIDYNQDGDWSDTGENIAINQSLSAGSNTLTLTPSNTAPHGATYARFRFTSTSVTTPEPTGVSADGEVEDYRINLLMPAPDPMDLCSSVIQNTGFETAPHPTTYLLKPEDEVQGWATIADNPNSGSNFATRNVIEVWKSGFGGVPAFEGDYFAELNANLPGTLYQDVELTPGSSYTWSFSHRGRSGTDTITVLMGPPDAVVSQGDFSTDNTAWKSYVGTYVVPAGQYITRFAFQATSASSYGNFVDAIKIPGGCDFGDAPDSYSTQIINNGPYHVSNALLYLGTGPGDSEEDGQPTVTADGDDNTGISDEDGISILETLSDVDRSYSVDVVTSNQTGQTASLIAWIDFDGNGTFDADEAAIRSVPTGTTNGSITLSWSNIPIDIQAGDSYLRLRLTTESMNNREPSGSKWDGEVEDYPITITPRASVSGRVYIDANSNATNDTGEAGIGGTVIVLLDTLTGECRSVATNGSGDYAFSGVADGSYTLYQAHGESTPVPQNCGTSFANNPTGYQSTTADTLSLVVSGTDLTDQDFGEVAGTNSASSGNTGIGITFEPDHQSEILPGNVKFYAHVFSTEADGSVSFTSNGVINTSSGWSSTLYNDSNCDGTLDDTEGSTPIGAINLGITAGNRFCIIDKVFAPANVTALDSYEVTITADFSYAAASLPNATLEVTDLTTAAQTVTPTTQTNAQLGESSLELTKTVENLTQATAETSTVNEAAAGDMLKYRIYYRNLGTGPITDLKVNDTVPDFTGLVGGSSACDVTPPGLSCTPAVTFDQLNWNFTGSLTGGASGYVSYDIILDN